MGRVVLICLIPAATGLACVVETLERKGRTIAAWALVFVCLAEQVVVTDTFDAQSNHATIEAIAQKVDRERVAFLYFPSGGGASVQHQLDAMWASLSSGVPTVNGYSGYAPRAWHPFFATDGANRAKVEQVLSDWETTHGLELGEIQWIDQERSTGERASGARGMGASLD